MAFEINGKTYETDEEGFLLNLAEWDRDAALHMLSLIHISEPTRPY